LLVLACFALAQTSGKVIIAAEDTFIVSEFGDFDPEKLEEKIDELVDEAIEEIEIEIFGEEEYPKEKLRKLVRKRMHEAIDEDMPVEMREKREKEYGMSGMPPGYPPHYHGKPDFDHPFLGRERGAGLVFLFIGCLVFMFVHLIMWIITLVVFYKSMSRISKALAGKNN